MAFMIGCEKVRVDFPTKQVFKDLSLGVDEGARIGIVGRNGDGKSTLLTLLSGALEPDEGRVVRTRSVTVGVLGQGDDLRDDETVHHAVVGDAPEYEWASNVRTRSILSGLISDIDWEAKVGTLSGGQRRRVDLARLLVGDWDVLMLDEPTNHLDMRAITWLANHLKGRWRPGMGALLVVTHDRWFLDEVCLQMWEVHDGVVEPFEGGFSAYIMQRVERDRLAALAEEKRQNQLRRELAWLSRGARARATKPKFHVKAARELIADVPELRNELELKRMAMARLGKQCVDVNNVTVRFDSSEDVPGKTVLKDVTWMIGPGDRFGLIGENGAGKTTLLRVIQGLQPLRAGNVKIGKTVRFAVLSQHLDNLKDCHPDERVRQVTSRFTRRTMLDGREMTPAQLLESLGFTNADMNERVHDLSGGQKRRLALMMILLEEPNVLILDEPGNDLDVDMLAQVESLLDGWPGTLVLVTHDRYLMERVTDHQYALIDGTLRHLPGGVDEYLRIVAERDWRKERQGEAKSFIKMVDSKTGAGGSVDPFDGDILAELGFAPLEGGEAGGEGAEQAKPKLSGGQIRSLRKIMDSNDRKMETLRGKIAAKEQEMTQVDPSDYVALTAVQDQIRELQEKLDELEMEWLEAAEQLGE